MEVRGGKIDRISIEDVQQDIERRRMAGGMERRDTDPAVKKGREDK